MQFFYDKCSKKTTKNDILYVEASHHTNIRTFVIKKRKHEKKTKMTDLKKIRVFVIFVSSYLSWYEYIYSKVLFHRQSRVTTHDDSVVERLLKVVTYNLTRAFNCNGGHIFRSRNLDDMDWAGKASPNTGDVVFVTVSGVRGKAMTLKIILLQYILFFLTTWPKKASI